MSTRKKSYTEPEKKRVRREAIAFAVESLTSKRDETAIASRNYVRKVKKHLLCNGNDRDKELASRLDAKAIRQWEHFHGSIIGEKLAKDLKVAYLCGPNPENDMAVLIRHGILPENVWAFESDTNTYNQAVIAALNSRFPFVKIYKGKIEQYLKFLHPKFDIVYLDFCGTINSTGTLSVVKELFLQQKLNSPGVLITNFSFPGEHPNNITDRDNLVKLSANYLFPKSSTEKLTGDGGGWTESPLAHGMMPDDYLEIGRKNPENFYSQLITRTLFDLATVVVPFQQFCNTPSLVNMFFRNFDVNQIPTDHFEWSGPEDASILAGVQDLLSEEPDPTFNTFLAKFRRQLTVGGDDNKLLQVLKLFYFFTGLAPGPHFNSPVLQEINDNWNAFEKYIFCDVFTFDQLKDILIGQLTCPYHYNVARTKRWTYKAKSTQMFMDLISFDQCRYVYDWMPTIDMLENGLEDINRELSLRFAMDSISKQRRWYNDEIFFGTAVVSGFDKGFTAKTLKKRIRI